MLLYPHKRVMVLLFRFITEVPAFVAIGIWFAFQIIDSLGMFGGSSGGVAYGAHLGGFAARLVLVKGFAMGTTAPPRALRSAAPHRRRSGN